MLSAAQRRAADMARLQKARSEKAREQNAAVEELRGVITHARQDHSATIRSLEAAVAVSRRSGMIEYRSTDNKAAGVLSEVMKRMEVIEKDLQGIDKQIEQQARLSREAVSSSNQTQCRNFSEWFAMNGRPKNTAMLSTHKPVFMRVENHGVSEAGQVPGSLSKTVGSSTTLVQPLSRSLGGFNSTSNLDKTSKSKTAGYVPLVDKSGFRLEPLPKSSYKPLLRGNLFRR